MISSPTRIVEITDVPVNIRKTPAFLDDPDAYPVTYATLRYASGGATIQLLSGSPFAKGTLTVVSNPANNETIDINGVTFTFKTTAAGATEVQIGADIYETAQNLWKKLRASANVAITPASYSWTYGADRVGIVYDTAGTGGNAFTLANSSASAVTRSAATLTGGQGYGDGMDVDADADYNDISQDLERYAVASGAGPVELSVTDYRA